MSLKNEPPLHVALKMIDFYVLIMNRLKRRFRIKNQNHLYIGTKNNPLWLFRMNICCTQFKVALKHNCLISKFGLMKPSRVHRNWGKWFLGLRLKWSSNCEEILNKSLRSRWVKIPKQLLNFGWFWLHCRRKRSVLFGGIAFDWSIAGSES